MNKIKIKRPLLFLIIGFIIGLLGGQMYLKQIHLSLLFLILLMISILLFILIHQKGLVLAFIMIISSSGLWVIDHPFIQEQHYFSENLNLMLKGEVIKIDENAFNSILTLKKVMLYQDNTWQKLYSKIQLQIPPSNHVKLYDKITVIATVLPPPKKMNPSDIDYATYLMSQGIVATLKSIKIDSLYSQTKNPKRLMYIIEKQIQKVFQNQDQGIIKTLLTGNDEHIPTEVYQAYRHTGIGHVLSISGFHIALLMSFILLVLSYLGFNYFSRYLVTCILLWLYTFLTGLSVSTLRACIMATFMIIARCIWEEEDMLTNLALAAAVILLANPFQLSQVGFQLSFMAVISLFLSKLIIEKLSYHVHPLALKISYILLPWVCISLGISPILAFHFYEIPILCTLLNLILIPVFSFIIIASWLTLGMSILSMKSAILLAQPIISLLDGILEITKSSLNWYLGVVCIGKPQIITICLYYLFLIFIVCYILGYMGKKVAMYSLSILIMMQITTIYLNPKTLDITYLYVGQGDGVVIFTPNKQVIVIDAGNFGKGKVVERYLKYKGKKRISAFILSHSDADHVGGLLDLLDTDIQIDHIFISPLDKSALLDQVIEKSIAQNIKVYKMRYLDHFTIDQSKFTCLSPKDLQQGTDNNNNSLVCLLQYKAFSGLFTGDIDQNQELQMYSILQSTTLLKVSHHGSKTGTAKQTLLKTTPEYAIISCGINNRYNHPHSNTLELLNKHGIKTLRTDQNGAIRFQTDGNRLLIDTQF